MSTTFLGLNVSPHNVATTLGATLGLFQILNGTLGLVSPATAVTNFGFAPKTTVSKAAAANPFVPVLGGRAISAGASFLALAYYRCHRAIALSLVAGCLTGSIDGFTVISFAEQEADPDAIQVARKAAWGHIGLTSGFAMIGAWVLWHLD